MSETEAALTAQLAMTAKVFTDILAKNNELISSQIEESLFDSTNKEDGKEIYTKDCHILPICKSYGQASYCCLAGAFVGKRCSYAEKMQIVIANDANPNATIKYPKPDAEEFSLYIKE